HPVRPQPARLRRSHRLAGSSDFAFARWGSAILVPIVVVMLVMVMFTGVLAVKFAAALVTSMIPVIMFAVTRHPDPFVSTVPIAAALVIRPIPNIDPEIECASARFEQKNSRQ